MTSGYQPNHLKSTTAKISKKHYLVYKIRVLNPSTPHIAIQKQPFTGLLLYCYNKDMKNTLQKGSIRYIVFKEKDTWYAVALEFNIVESGDDPREVLMLLFEAVEGYVRSARKYKARPAILNQKADEEYEKLWKILQTQKEGVKSKQRIPMVATFGRQSLATA